MANSTALKNARGNDREFQAIVDKRRRDRMSKIDGLPPDMRALVHEYGFNVVQAFLDLGVTKSRHIRHLVETVLDAFSPTRGSSSAQGTRADIGIRANHPLMK